jgi:predicted TIM-barrel fold metal-dependent hydrolase
VHGYAPFDPLREVAYKAKKTGASWSSLAFAQDAIRNRGCIGIKLYPPMGFAPYGNAEITTPHFWKQNDLPEWLDQPIYYSDDGQTRSLGERLDEALAELYKWCCDESVPILAHSNTTNGVLEQYRELASASYWNGALARYPNLRISFGHLGDFSSMTGTADIPSSSEAFIRLFADAGHMSDYRRYGDSAYDAEILRNSPSLLSRYVSAYSNQTSPGNKILASRLMYGTDWNLLMTVGKIDSYFKQFLDIFTTLDSSGQSVNGHSVMERFFGWNAVDYIGLRRGQPARQRLEEFYRRHDIDLNRDPPGWMRKVDAFGS